MNFSDFAFFGLIRENPRNLILLKIHIGAIREILSPRNFWIYCLIREIFWSKFPNSKFPSFRFSPPLPLHSLPRSHHPFLFFLNKTCGGLPWKNYWIEWPNRVTSLFFDLLMTLGFNLAFFVGDLASGLNSAKIK